MFDSGEYDFAFVKRLIDTYRNKYSCVPKFWNRVEQAWRVAARYGREETVGRLRFWREGSTMFIALPSGRTLRYHGARVDSDNQLHYVSGRNHCYLWGGPITGNIVQATCRDYLGLWILKTNPIYPVVHHVYDELICLVGEHCAEEAKKQIVGIMSRGPEWADDMPFKAEAKISKCYKK